MRAAWWLLMATGCVQGVTQVAGTGAIYTTRCSAEMEVTGVEYLARCTPSTCAPGFEDRATNHVIVTIEPGQKLLGYAERVCVQDLSDASARFQPVTDETTEPKATKPE
jgi:hypothetical protein